VVSCSGGLADEVWNESGGDACNPSCAVAFRVMQDIGDIRNGLHECLVLHGCQHTGADFCPYFVDGFAFLEFPNRVHAERKGGAQWIESFVAIPFTPQSDRVWGRGPICQFPFATGRIAFCAAGNHRRLVVVAGFDQ